MAEATNSPKYNFLFPGQERPKRDGRWVPRAARGSRKREIPMGTAEQYRRAAWDCLKLAETTSNPQTSSAMLNLAQEWVSLAEQAERNDQYRLAGYRAKAWECLSLAESVNDPERRVDLLLFGRMWLSLTEPIEDDLRGAYELPPRLAA